MFVKYLWPFYSLFFSCLQSWTVCVCCMRRPQWVSMLPSAVVDPWWKGGHASLLWQLMKHMSPKSLKLRPSPSTLISAHFQRRRSRLRNKREQYFLLHLFSYCICIDSENWQLDIFLFWCSDYIFLREKCLDVGITELKECQNFLSLWKNFLLKSFIQLIFITVGKNHSRIKF